MNNFKAIIKDLRKAHGLTQLNLAEILHVSKSTVSSWEKGVLEPKASHLISMSKLFNVSADYLLDLKPSDCKCDTDLLLCKNI